MKPRIFLVEDDLDISRLVRHHLETAGFAVRAFSSGDGVISGALSEAPSLFLLDIMIPGPDGLELCRRIRQTPRLAVIPFDSRWPEEVGLLEMTNHEFLDGNYRKERTGRR